MGQLFPALRASITLLTTQPRERDLPLDERTWVRCFVITGDYIICQWEQRLVFLLVTETEGRDLKYVRATAGKRTLRRRVHKIENAEISGSLYSFSLVIFLLNASSFLNSFLFFFLINVLFSFHLLFALNSPFLPLTPPILLCILLILFLPSSASKKTPTRESAG